MPATLLRESPRITPDVVRVTDGTGVVLWTPTTFYSSLVLLYGFPVDTMGFSGGSGATGSADALSRDTSSPLTGTGSLVVTRLWGSGTDFVTARGPQIAVGSRDLSGNNADALGVKVRIPNGSPGSSWQLRMYVVNSAGTVEWSSSPVPLRVGVTEQVWVQVLPSVLMDVMHVEARVYASGVNTTVGVAFDSFYTGASGALYPEEPEQPGASVLWEAPFGATDPKAGLHVEAGTETGATNLTFPTVNGTQRARIAFPTVNNRFGYQGRIRLTDLSLVGQQEATFEYEVALPSADVLGRDLRLPSVAGLPEEQPGTYTSLDGVTQPDSWSAVTHVKAGSTTTTGGGGVLLDQQMNESDTVTGTVGSHPEMVLETGGSTPCPIGGGVLTIPTGSTEYHRLYFYRRRYGGPGQSVRIKHRARATALHQTVYNDTVAGSSLWLKFTEPQYDQNNWVYSTSANNRDPGSFILRTGMNASQRAEVAINQVGPGSYIFGSNESVSWPVGQWRDVTIGLDHVGTDRWRVRYWFNADGSGTPFYDWTGYTGPDTNKPFWLAIRSDFGRFEYDYVRVEDTSGSGETTTTVIPPWGEETLYVQEAAGRTSPPDLYGYRFPYRSDLVQTSGTDRSVYWQPPTDGTPFRVRKRVKVNTPGVADGELDVFIDGRQYARVRNILWADPVPPISQLLLSVLYPSGGATVAGRTVDLLSMSLSSVSSLPPPGEPSNLTVGTVTATSVELLWTGGADASSHDVLRNGQVVAAGVGTAFTDTGLTPSTTYNYSVWAVNAAGVSAPTTAVPVTTGAGTVTQAYLPGDPFTSAFDAKWTVPAAARIDAGRGAIDYVTNVYTRLITPPQDWTGKAGSLDFLSAPPSGARHDYTVRIDAQNNYEVVHFGTSDTLVVQRYVAGVKTTLSTIAAPALPFTVRVRETGGQIVIEHRPAAGGSWVELVREAAQINMSVAREAITAFAPSGVTGTFLFDNNNLAGA